MKTSLRRQYPVLAFVLALALVASGCSTSRKTTAVKSQQPVAATLPKHPPVKAGTKAPATVADALVAEARQWLGVPYVSGGKTRQGADCSGFLMAVYRDAAGVDLPRTTADQWLFCAPIAREQAAVGDILFFSSRRSEGKIAHVGMYIGNGRMIHASSSRGVVEDDLSLKYYTEHYLGTGHVPQIADATPAIQETLKNTPPQITIPAPVPPRTVAVVHIDSLSVVLPNRAPVVAVPTDTTTVTDASTVANTSTVTDRPATVVANAFAKIK